MEGGGRAVQRAERGGRDQARHTDGAGQGGESDCEPVTEEIDDVDLVWHELEESFPFVNPYYSNREIPG